MSLPLTRDDNQRRKIMSKATMYISQEYLNPKNLPISIYILSWVIALGSVTVLAEPRPQFFLNLGATIFMSQKHQVLTLKKLNIFIFIRNIRKCLIDIFIKYLH